MGNALLAFRNRVDEATLSGGSWTAGLPLANLQTRVLSQLARSTDVLAASTLFRVALPQGRNIGVLALCRHNFSSTATYRITAYQDNTYGVPARIYDSGYQPVWPAVYDTLSLEWEDDNYWTGIFSLEDRSTFYWNVVHVLPSTTYVPYWQIEIVDTTNTAGYVQFGRLFMGQVWTPVVNMDWGAAINYTSRSDVAEAYGGEEYFNKKAAYRVVSFSLSNMAVSEAMTKALDIQRISDVTDEILFTYDSSDTANLLRRSFLGRLQELNPIEQPYVSLYKSNFKLKELL